MNEIKDGGPEIFVSECDKDIFLNSSWIIGANGYAYRKGGRIKGRQCLLHRIIMNPQNGNEIHHRNGNKLDNRRENLEEITPSQHQLYHLPQLIRRNKLSRIYPLTAICAVCSVEFTRDKNHRGRATCCSKRCGMMLAIQASAIARIGKPSNRSLARINGRRHAQRAGEIK